MALSTRMQDALNQQLMRELYSAYLYLSMAAYFESLNLSGFAHWMEVQAREEVSHALRFYRQLCDRNGRVLLQAIAQPPATFKNPLEVLEQVQRHETMVTEEIQKLYALAAEEKDYTSQTFLHWFLTEQVEEEKQSTQLLERLRLAGDDRSALLVLDREMGARTAEEA